MREFLSVIIVMES